MATITQRRKPQVAQEVEVPRVAPPRRSRDRRKGKIGPCSIMILVLLFIALFLYGGKLFRYTKSSFTRSYVPGWETDDKLKELATALEDDIAFTKGQCQFPRYPDSLTSTPRIEDFLYRYWRNAKHTTLLVEIGSMFWPIRSIVSSKESIEGAVQAAGGFTLHFAHSNKTAMEHHAHLEQVFSPADPLEAPWVEVQIPSASHQLPSFFLPTGDDEGKWTAMVIPALSGHAPTIARDRGYYFVVLTGKVRFISYAAAFSFEVMDDHTWDWHETKLHKIRSSGNHGRMCIVRTDEAVLVPIKNGYAFAALENTVMLRIPLKP